MVYKKGYSTIKTGFKGPSGANRGHMLAHCGGKGEGAVLFLDLPVFLGLLEIWLWFGWDMPKICLRYACDCMINMSILSEFTWETYDIGLIFMIANIGRHFYWSKNNDWVTEVVSEKVFSSFFNLLDCKIVENLFFDIVF